MDPERLKPILEAALLASPQPLTPALLADLFEEGERPPLDLVAQVLHALADDCQGRGVELVEVGSGFRYQVKAEVFPHISALWTERQSRYSRALLETLSLIAYRQPITRGEIEQIRGVAVATSILRTIEEREWVRVVGHRDVPGKPALYGTTRAFLDYFQLGSLDQLPPLSALRDLESLEPELSFEVPAPGAPALPPPDADADAEPAADTDADGDDDNDPDIDPDADSGRDADADGTAPDATSDADDAASADLDGDRDDDTRRARA
jgi:segregation and condensation protein B